MQGIFSKIFGGNKSEKDCKKILPIVRKINEEYETLASLSHDELRERSQSLKQRIKDAIQPKTEQIDSIKKDIEENTYSIEQLDKLYQEIDELEGQIDDQLTTVLDDLLVPAFALIKETARRFSVNKEIKVTATEQEKEWVKKHDFISIEGNQSIYTNSWEAGGNKVEWNMIHYDVQLIGGVVLHQGKIAEMATGEGKTLVATLPVFLNALTGRGVHLVTVNSYLARRDADWMQPIYMFHQLTVDCIDDHEPNTEERRKAYHADITFGTNNEFGFDYLRDNMVQEVDSLVQRKHVYAIVDEVDSVLIDDARTPLIISGPVPRSTTEEMFVEYRPRVQQLYQLQEQLVKKLFDQAKSILSKPELTKQEREEGGLALLRAHKGLPKHTPLINFLSEEGMKSILLKTENFYMQDNSKNMHKVTDELYFVIDEKRSSVDLTDKGFDALSKNAKDPNFFVLPDIGSEIATLESSDATPEKKAEEKASMLQDFSVKSERVHTITQLLKAYTMFTIDEQYIVADNKVKIVDEQTGRVMDGRRYSDGLHQAIEAKENVKVEASSQTYATVTLQNYFRMYNKLAGMTGTAITEAGEFWDIYKLDVVAIPSNKPLERKDHNDYLYKTSKEKYKAIVEETQSLIEEKRAVLVGTTSVESSERLSNTLKRHKIKHNVLNAKHHEQEAQIISEAGQPGVVTIATNMAGRGTDIKLAPEVKEAGGLAIIGTERHEARRVDNQLRGRAGRQGDPGSSQFFISLEDNLMRLFASDRISRMLDRMGHKEGEVIQAGLITKSIGRAQRKVEENNFGIRKHLLEYDDVLNSQREVIYTRRRHALRGEKLESDISDIVHDTVEHLVEQFHGHSTFEDFNLECIRVLGVSPSFSEEDFLGKNMGELAEALTQTTLAGIDRAMNKLSEMIYPVVRKIKNNNPQNYTNISLPISDGKSIYNLTVNIEKSVETEGREVVKTYQKMILLMNIDGAWQEQLRELDSLRQAVRNVRYEQKNPLLVYKLESFNLFKQMLLELNEKIVTSLINCHIPGESELQQLREAQMSKMDAAKEYKEDMKNALSSVPNEKKEPPKKTPVVKEKLPGRNDPCWCGSGKKFKVCHGKSGVA